MNYINYVEINSENLRFNIDYLRKENKYKYLVFDVSNNAYGHGMYIINYVKDLIDYLYCFNFNDVQLIRKYDKDVPVIFGGIVNADNIYDLVMMNAIIVVRNKEIIEEFIEMQIKDKMQFILEIDVMGYRGIDDEQEITSILELIENSKLELLGIMASVIESEYELFKKIISPIPDTKVAILNNESDKNKIKGSNTIRLESSIYGINNFKKKLFSKDINLPLRQVFTLNSKIVKIKIDLSKKKEQRLAVIPFGYLQGMVDTITKVYINKKFYKVNLISDNYSLIEVDLDINEDDIVEVIGTNNPLELYISKNVLEYLSVFGGNLPIVYEDYALEKTFVY